MATDEEIESLQIFVESTTELEESSFVAQAKQGISTSMRQLIDRAILLERRGPEHEAVKALLLTVRFFCQDNETSIRKTGELIEGLAVSDTLKADFVAIRDRLNKFLDAESPVKFQTSVGADKNKDIFYTYLYGSFAHADRVKRRRIKSWDQMPYSNDLRAQFDVILLRFVHVVIELKAVCIKILAELEAAPS
jgi:hypothetical protein